MTVLVASALSDVEFWESALSTGVRLSVPLGLAALGELVNERAGVLNLGVEGTMALGALSGAVVAASFGASVGLLGGLVVGALVGLVFSLLVVRARINEIIVGFALALGGVALASFLFRAGFEDGASARPFGTVRVPGLADLPLLGPVLFEQPLVVWLLPIALAVTAWVLRETTWGLMLRAAGDGPEAAASRGLSVERVRVTAVTIGCALGGLAGSMLSAGFVGEFSEQIVGGRGFVALAIVIAAGWRPWLILPLVLVVGSLQGFQLAAQGSGDVGVPLPFLQALPYVVTLAVLAFGLGSSRAPRTLGRMAQP